MSRFAGQTAIVTGYSRGIGQATAYLLAEEGAELVLVGRQRTDIGLPREPVFIQGELMNNHLASLGGWKRLSPKPWPPSGTPLTAEIS